MPVSLRGHRISKARLESATTAPARQRSTTGPSGQALTRRATRFDCDFPGQKVWWHPAILSRTGLAMNFQNSFSPGTILNQQLSRCSKCSTCLAESDLSSSTSLACKTDPSSHKLSKLLFNVHIIRTLVYYALPTLFLRSVCFLLVILRPLASGSCSGSLKS